MKVGYSLPESIVSWVERTAEQLSDGNSSLVVAAALAHFAALNEQALRRLILRQRAERNTGSRDAWMRTFWQWLAGLFDASDTNVNPYAPRTYGNFMIVFLLKGRGEPPGETDPFHIHTTAAHDVTLQDRHTWTSPRLASPVEAAENVASWIRARSDRAAS